MTVTDDNLAYARGAEQLVHVVQELSLARDLDAVMAIVRRAARELTGADGATLVLRDGDSCYHAGEAASEPLWQRERLPLDSCASGWAMRHGSALVLDDITADPALPADALLPPFANSLVIVPIRRLEPVGAIGNYWATPQRPSDTSVRLLQALADSTSIAMANVELLANLESRVAERTAQLEAANRELEAFSYTVSHDLRAPLRTITAFSQALLDDHADALGAGKPDLQRICAAAARMTTLIDDLLQLATAGRSELERAPFDAARHVREIVDELRRADPERKVEVIIPDTLPAHGDSRLVRVVLENLVRNAWKFTSKRPTARIEIGGRDGALFVRDDGAGFDAAHADRLFSPFQRLHTAEDFEGTGIGLATAQRIVARHGGRIWADSAPGQGATFTFTLG